MMNDHIKDLILKFTLEAATESELKELSDILEKDPSIAVELEISLRAKSLILSKSVNQNIIGEFENGFSRSVIRNVFNRFSRIAAIFIGIAIIVSAITFSLYDFHKNRSVNSLQSKIIIANKGEIKVVKLEDGTRVCLAPDSKIVIPVNFSDKKREVSLTGEAYFEVTRDVNRPFEVKTQHSRIQVLGTKFNIHAYSNESFEQTALLEGKVQVRLCSKGRVIGKKILKPNTAVCFDSKTGRYAISSADFENILAWQKKRIVFNNERLEDIAKRIERFYNVKIEISDSQIANSRFSAEFDKESVDEILKSFQIIAPFSYEQRGQTYYLTNK
jgi:ferric-dicitrate binding protein FerR (iron transport regulator)